MHPASLLPLLTFTTAALLPHPQSLINTALTPADLSALHFPTVHESTIFARRLLHLSGQGTLSTIFPSTPHAHDPLASTPHTSEIRPPSVAHLPFGLPEYIASCEPQSANPTILQVDIANTFRNAAAGSNVTLSVPWVPPGRREGEYSAAMMPRVAVVGWLQEIFEGAEGGGAEAERVTRCWLERHPDTIWTPGSDIHISRWVRLVVEEIYWFGGFGDRARIQWLDPEEFKKVTAEEIGGGRLPGEREGDDVGKGSIPTSVFEEL